MPVPGRTLAHLGSTIGFSMDGLTPIRVRAPGILREIYDRLADAARRRWPPCRHREPLVKNWKLRL